MGVKDKQDLGFPEGWGDLKDRPTNIQYRRYWTSRTSRTTLPMSRKRDVEPRERDAESTKRCIAEGFGSFNETLRPIFEYTTRFNTLPH